MAVPPTGEDGVARLAGQGQLRFDLADMADVEEPADAEQKEEVQRKMRKQREARAEAEAVMPSPDEMQEVSQVTGGGTAIPSDVHRGWGWLVLAASRCGLELGARSTRLVAGGQAGNWLPRTTRP